MAIAFATATVYNHNNDYK